MLNIWIQIVIINNDAKECSLYKFLTRSDAIYIARLTVLLIKDDPWSCNLCSGCPGGGGRHSGGPTPIHIVPDGWVVRVEWFTTFYDFRKWTHCCRSGIFLWFFTSIKFEIMQFWIFYFRPPKWLKCFLIWTKKKNSFEFLSLFRF